MPHKPTRTPRAQTRTVDQAGSHRSRGLAPPAQDVDWDNDATTSFRRTLEDPRWASDEPSWSGNLSSLLEPDAFSELTGPITRPATIDDLPPPAAKRAPARQSLVSIAPLSLEEPRLGIEGSLARSLHPQRSRWVRSLYFILPMFLVLGAGLYWNPRGNYFEVGSTPWWPLTPPPRSLARGLPMSEHATTLVEPEPPAELAPAPPPVAAAATGAALPAADSEELSALAAFEEPAATLSEQPAPEVRKTKARTKRSERAAARRRQREARRARQAALAAPIMPMPDATPDEEIESSAIAANQGVLQINSRPWARVIVDGQFVGHTPQRSLKLTPGKHRIRLENEPLDMSKTFDVVITSGRTVTRVEMLEENATAERTSKRD